MFVKGNDTRIVTDICARRAAENDCAGYQCPAVQRTHVCTLNVRFPTGGLPTLANTGKLCIRVKENGTGRWREANEQEEQEDEEESNREAWTGIKRHPPLRLLLSRSCRLNAFWIKIKRRFDTFVAFCLPFV